MMTDKLFPPEFLRAIDIHELLPQQEPFVMVGRLTFFDKRRTITETTVKDENLFVSEGMMSASGLIENIAQTCAARIGFVNKYILKKGIQVGFIGAIRNLTVLGLPKTGETMTTTVDVLEERLWVGERSSGIVFGMTLAHAEITCGGETLVTTEIKIALKEG